jgi:hypothetical protein
MVRMLAAGALITLALAGCVETDFGYGDAVHSVVHERFTADARVHLSVANVSGDVRVLQWNQNLVDIVAIKRASSSQGLHRMTVEIDRDQSPAQSVSIRTRYENEWFGHSGGSVDYTLHVPRGASLDVSEVSGDVLASDLDGSVHVHSVSGDVTTMRVGGNLTVHSISGDVHASMLQMNGNREADIDTVSGDIHLALPPSANAYVDAKSLSGDFDSAWSIPIQHQLVGVEASGTIGSGGGDVTLKSISGDISLART